MDKLQLGPILRRGAAVLLSWTASLIWTVLILLKNLTQFATLRTSKDRRLKKMANGGIANGKTVLVTTGRQAKTVHIVRALKAVGATVIVTDYDYISASAVSLACDKFIVMPPLDTSKVQLWIRSFRDILIDNNVDMVVPVSTINEVLFIGLARQQLEMELPHVQWRCPDLELAMLLDDRSQFSDICERYNVPVPESGVLTSPNLASQLASSFDHGIVLKRMESSVNREEEILAIEPNGVVPSFFKPTSTDPWQWQRFITGEEFSVWYVCINGRVTFTSCYKSEPDLVHFDPVCMDKELDASLRTLIKGLNLTGQFAFDFIQEKHSGRSFVIECNPRASSILETVSNTPLWAESFFGVDVTMRTIFNNVGFVYHRNCWPWSSRSEGYFNFNDPLPFFGAEVAWPLKAIADKGLGQALYQKIDVNICKIIVSGRSAGRDLKTFRENLSNHKVSIALASLQHVDTLFLDVCVPDAPIVFKRCKAGGTKVVLFCEEDTTAPSDMVGADGIVTVPKGVFAEELMAKYTEGETRTLLGSKLSKQIGSHSEISYRIVEPGATWSVKNELTLRRLRVLHVMGSGVNEFYETLSTRYGYDCIGNIGIDGRFEHFVAKVRPSGHWIVEPFLDETYVKERGERISPGSALKKIEELSVDVVLPHMFDYEGLTAVRSVFDILKIPMIGCTAEALALSTNKARTNACARVAGVRVPDFEVLRKGDRPTMQLPVVIKPSEEDNSQGITVVYQQDRIEEALEHAFEFCDEVLCEEFIAPGREVRVGLIERSDGQLEMLPIIEYLVSASDPVRTREHKLKTTSTGSVTSVTGSAPGGVILPANIDAELKEKLYRMTSTAHKALGCRDYSIYDIRVNRDGEPVMLETCLYCSFSPSSVLVKMQAAMAIDKRQLFNRLCERAMTRRAVINEARVGTGMRLR